MRRIALAAAIVFATVTFTAPATEARPPKAHAAWDVAAEGSATCHVIDGTIKSANPSSGNFAIIVERSIGTNPPFAERILDHYSPGDMSFHLLSGIPQNGTTATIKVWLIDHDSLNRATPRPRDVTTVGVFPVGPCGSPPPAVPASPSQPPSSTPEGRPGCPIPSPYALRREGPRSFRLEGPLAKHRWKVNGVRVLPNPGTTYTVPGTGRDKVAVVGRCFRLKRVALPPAPPATAGRYDPPPAEVQLESRRATGHAIRKWNKNPYNARAIEGVVGPCNADLYKPDPPERWRCRATLNLDCGAYSPGTVRVRYNIMRNGDGSTYHRHIRFRSAVC